MVNTVMQEFIYILAIVKGKPFYVGRTNDMKRRLSEHKRDSAFGTESKYQFIRDLDDKGMAWEMVLLEEVGPGTEHYEDFWVYTLLLEGYELQNMKMGDAAKAAERDAMQRMAGRKERYSDARTFLAAREREVAEARARAATARLNARIKRVSDPTQPTTTRFVDDVKQAKESPALAAIRKRRFFGHLRPILRESYK